MENSGKFLRARRGRRYIEMGWVDVGNSVLNRSLGSDLLEDWERLDLYEYAYELGLLIGLGGLGEGGFNDLRPLYRE